MRLVETLPDNIKKGNFRVEEEPIEINLGNGKTRKVRVQSSDSAEQIKSAVGEILALSKAELEKQQQISVEIQEVAKSELTKANIRIAELEQLVQNSKDAILLKDMQNLLELTQTKVQQLENENLLAQKAMLDAISVLIADREFGPNYFKRMRWSNMTKADQALFYLLKQMNQLGNMGTPKGFKKVGKNEKSK